MTRRSGSPEAIPHPTERARRPGGATGQRRGGGRSDRPGPWDHGHSTGHPPSSPPQARRERDRRPTSPGRPACRHDDPAAVRV